MCSIEAISGEKLVSVNGIIGVVGSGDENSELNALALEVGALVAKAGYVLVSGGLGGVMEASAKGAKEAGGLTVGLLPGSRRSDANPYIRDSLFLPAWEICVTL